MMIVDVNFVDGSGRWSVLYIQKGDAVANECEWSATCFL